MLKKIIIFAVTSLIIGNTVAWFSGAAPIEFAKIPYSEQESEQLKSLSDELKKFPNDTSLLVEMGSIYSMHNRLDQAEQTLVQALSIEPDNSAASAWLNANKIKQVGAMLDLSMGMYKLYLLNKSVEELSNTVTKAPDDLAVRMTRMITFSFLGEVNPRFEEVFDDEAWILETFKNQGEHLPKPVFQSAYVALANAYLVKYQQGENAALNKSVKYLSLAQGLGQCPETLAKECHRITELQSHARDKV
ncbi:MAG: hypothetical protein OQJ89_06035 [Kangiellaceae bacterium]|nr:hypothetical protein [Kangiellaceae bacterium]MCW8998081.1 hypothetical protein [Kangiellaceae bacterium]MCW9016501.1 hypothetical protein [Kangiellaceae bacterium]